MLNWIYIGINVIKDDAMKISCRENSTSCIFKLHSNVLTLELVFRLKKILKRAPKNKNIALNLQHVESFCAEFLEFLREFSKQNKLSVINLQAELFVLLNLTQYDEFAHIYLTDTDFVESKRALLNRRFSVISNY